MCPRLQLPGAYSESFGVSCKCEERSSGGIERFAASKLSCSARNMQLSDCENANGFWEDADGRQLDCQLRMLKQLVEELHALRLEKEQDFGRFSGDIADHGQRIKSPTSPIGRNLKTTRKGGAIESACIHNGENLSASTRRIPHALPVENPKGFARKCPSGLPG
jgi:hypothetical protein